jgi:hypothetical protein
MLSVCTPNANILHYRIIISRPVISCLVVYSPAPWDWK